MRIFADKLKELRTEQGLSIFELSKKTGVSVGAICHWENNKSDIKSDQLTTIAKFFGVTTDYLLGLEN